MDVEELIRNSAAGLNTTANFIPAGSVRPGVGQVYHVPGIGMLQRLGFHQNPGAAMACQPLLTCSKVKVRPEA